MQTLHISNEHYRQEKYMEPDIDAAEMIDFAFIYQDLEDKSGPCLFICSYLVMPLSWSESRERGNIRNGI